jgi:cobalt-precorrin-5B (C1)-methyltransferase
MIADPVTGFVYPASWIERCRDPALLAAVGQGLAVLTADGAVRRRGFSTGTTAAAACKAAVLSIQGTVEEVGLVLPCGLAVRIPAEGRYGVGTCRKFAGDYLSDATAGACFVARAVQAACGTHLVAGVGIGRWVRDSPRARAGDPAISAPALASILQAVGEACAAAGIAGVVVTLSVPDGAAIAMRTLNARVGVEGGISVLGTTGLVEPWDDHLEAAAHERIRMAERPVLTTGRTGLGYARRLFPDREVILVGSGLPEALVHAPEGTVVCGLPGLVLKAIDPDILDGTGFATVEEFAQTPGFAAKAEEVLRRFKASHPGFRVVIVDRQGRCLGDSG